MSRSHHITKGEAARILATEADAEGVVRYQEKRAVKKGVKKFRGIYALIHPSAKSPNKLKNKVIHQTVKDFMKAKQQSIAKRKGERSA